MFSPVMLYNINLHTQAQYTSSNDVDKYEFMGFFKAQSSLAPGWHAPPQNSSSSSSSNSPKQKYRLSSIPQKSQNCRSGNMSSEMVAAASATSQLSCFSAISRQLHNQRPSLLSPARRSQPWVVMSLEGGSSDVNTTLSYASSGDALKPHVQKAASGLNSGSGTSSEPPQLEEEQMGVGAEKKRAAKIHDFCFGIPFGGMVLGGGLLGFVFTRNLSTLSSGVLYGGALLALSTFSLKIWRQGKSSLPFILGQGALAAALLWKNFQTYSLTKKVFPTGIYAAISAAMLCFYSYVVLSGGNPPPKKLKASPSVAS